MIVMVMVIIMAMRDAHAPRDRRTRHPAHNATNHGARRPSHGAARNRPDPDPAQPLTRRRAGGKA